MNNSVVVFDLHTQSSTLMIIRIAKDIELLENARLRLDPRTNPDHAFLDMEIIAKLEKLAHESEDLKCEMEALGKLN